jgi:glycosyltransferase involved in cell wall biosynthesis
MKITLISTLPPIKGLSHYTQGLVFALSKYIDIDFIGFKHIYPDFLYPGGAIDKNSIIPKFNQRVHIRNSLTWYNPLSWVLAGLSIKTDVVHAQWWSWFLAPIYLTILTIAKLKGKKIIITIHNVKPHEKSFYKVYLNKSVLFLADEYIVHSQASKDLFLETDETNKPVHIVPTGIMNITPSAKSIHDLRKKYGYTHKDKILLFFGNIREYKGVDILIKTLALITDTNVKLIIAGKPWGSFFKYKKLINQNNLQNRIKLFLAYIPESTIAELFKITDVAVYPYREFVGSSGATTIALNFEKAIVITAVGGLNDMVNDQKVIAKPNDIKDLAQKISYALSNQSRLSSDSSLICQKFLWDNIVRTYLPIYKK